MSLIQDFYSISPQGQIIPNESKSPFEVMAFLEQNPALFSTHAAETTALLDYLSTKNVIVKKEGDYPKVKAQFEKLFPEVYKRELEKNQEDEVHRLIEQAKTEKGAEEVVHNIHKVSILKEEDRVKVALECAKTNQGANAVSNCIRNFQINKEENRIKIALECAKTGLVYSIDNFEISGIEDRIKILRESLKISSVNRSFFTSAADIFNLTREQQLFRTFGFAEVESSRLSFDKKFEYLKSFAKRNSLDFPGAFKILEIAKNYPELSSKMLSAFSKFLLFYLISDDETKKWVRSDNLIDKNIYFKKQLINWRVVFSFYRCGSK